MVTIVLMMWIGLMQQRKSAKVALVPLVPASNKGNLSLKQTLQTLESKWSVLVTGWSSRS